MPDPPAVGLFTRYVLENPWPPGIALVVVGAWLAWTDLRSGDGRRLVPAAVVAALGGAVLVAGALVVTPGEHGRRVARDLVAAAVEADVAAASALFTEDATLALGSPRNPGLPRGEIERRIDQLDGRWRIASNSIPTLKGYTASPDSAEVHLACRTTLENGFGPAPTQWVLTVERDADGRWLISRVTWISLAGRSPGPDTGL